jgi:type II secretory pathway predicted ATPase ExeA/nucleoid-associated protein YgaU
MPKGGAPRNSIKISTAQGGLWKRGSPMTALEYYKLQEQPFGVTPDSRYLFLTATQKEALHSVIYGIESGCGFVALIARPGLGKTTLLFQTLEILREKARLVFLFQTISTPVDLLRALLSGLGAPDMRASLVEMQIRLKNLLAEQYIAGRRVVLVIDEAQNLDDSVLELVRMLSNFETASDKLIQIVLAGQPQLAENIGSPELVQLRQRVSIFARLHPFTGEETSLYIAHRLRVAGYASDMPLFTKDALALIAQSSDGIPRNINNLCFNALSLGAALQQKPIDREIVRQVTADLDIGQVRPKFPHLQPTQERVTLKAAPIYSSPKSASVSAKRLPKVAVAAVVLLAVGVALFAARKWLVQPAEQPTAAAYVPPTPAEPPVSMASEPPLSATVDTPAQVPSAEPPPRTALPAGRPPSVQTDTPVSLDLPHTSPLFSDRTPQWTDSADLVNVTPGQTLLGICAEKFGNCTAQILRQIQQLNPHLSDPDHIETGQQLRIPVLAAQTNNPSSEKDTHE